MRKYERPDAIVIEEVSEGVYAASGDASSECWTVSAKSVQNWTGSHHVFEVHCKHSTSVQHISSATTVKLMFNAPVTDAYSESSCTFSGNTVTVVREAHANGYGSGDNVSFKVWVSAGDEGTTKGISCQSATISCKTAVNVQGGGADGN